MIIILQTTQCPETGGHVIMAMGQEAKLHKIKPNCFLWKATFHLCSGIKKQLERNEVRQIYKHNYETLCPTTCLAVIWHHRHGRTRQCRLTPVSWLAHPHLHSGPALITSTLKPQLPGQFEPSLAKSGHIFRRLLITLWALLLAQEGTLQTKLCVQGADPALNYTVGLSVSQLSTAAYCTTVKMPVLQQRSSVRQVPSFQKNSGCTVILKLPGKVRQLFCKEQQDFP